VFRRNEDEKEGTKKKGEKRRRKGTYRQASRTRLASPFVPAIRVAANAIASGKRTLCSRVEFGCGINRD